MPKVPAATRRSSRTRSHTHASNQAKPSSKPEFQRPETDYSRGVRAEAPHSTSSSSLAQVSSNAAAPRLSLPFDAEVAAGILEPATWSISDDEALMQARAQGWVWSHIALEHFPSKTANACRERHERLMERQNAEQRNDVQLDVLAEAYKQVRREMWSVLAARVGEKWHVVEQKCMEKGLTDLTRAPRKSEKDRAQIEAPTEPAVASKSESKTMPPPRTVDVPTASLPQQDVQRPSEKRSEDRHLQHFDHFNSNASRVPDALKERLKYTISTDGTAHDAARHKLRFMALERTTTAGATRHIL